MAWPALAAMNVLSFWIVVMMIREAESSSWVPNTLVDVLELAAPFSNRSYSFMVW